MPKRAAWLAGVLDAVSIAKRRRQAEVRCWWERVVGACCWRAWLLVGVRFAFMSKLLAESGVSESESEAPSVLSVSGSSVATISSADLEM